jgi:hypothetical protein
MAVSGSLKPQPLYFQRNCYWCLLVKTLFGRRNWPTLGCEQKVAAPRRDQISVAKPVVSHSTDKEIQIHNKDM